VKRLLFALLSACTAEEVSLGAWELDAGVVLPLDASAPSPYFEAEEGELRGFERVDARGASHGAALIAPSGTFDDAPGQARAHYRFAVPRDATYVLWARMQAPGASHNRVWFQVDGGSWHKWRISTGDVFFWDDLHEDADYGNPLRFVLAAGEHSLTLANCVDGWRLDRFYVTADGDEPPGNTTLCAPPHSIELAGTCQPSCGAQNGRRCGEQACAGRPPIAAYDCAVCCAYP
jgi:hypothetical protein